MIILVCNAGSTSLKFKLYEMPETRVLATGKVERVGSTDDAIFGYCNVTTGYKVDLVGQNIPNYKVGIEKFLSCLYQRFRDVFGVDAAEYDRCETIREGKYPLMVTAGSNEKMEEVLSIIKERNPQPTTVLILPGCNHGNGMYKQTELYQNAIREFAERYM